MGTLRRDSNFTEMRLPMAGLYPVITWQFNLTMHQATGLAKWVSILREPTEQFEISRQFQDLDPWETISGPVADTLMGEVEGIGNLVGRPAGCWNYLHQRYGLIGEETRWMGVDKP